MSFNVMGEISVCILSIVLLFNVISSYSLNEKSSKFFFYCVLNVFVCTLSDITSVYTIYNYRTIPLWLNNVVNIIFFLSLGTIPFLFSMYCCNFISHTKKHQKLFRILSINPIIIFGLIVITNPLTNLIFSFDPELGYVRGPLKHLTYIITFYYALTVIFVALKHRSEISRRLIFVFMIYPLIGFSINLIQFFNPELIFTGTSSFATLLLMYLAVQTNFTEFDFTSGLPTEITLAHLVARKKDAYCITFFSIENYNTIYETLGSKICDNLLLDIANKLTDIFGKTTFRVGTKFAVITPGSKDIQKKISRAINHCEYYNTDKTSSRIEIIASSVCVPEHATTYKEAFNIANTLIAKIRNIKGQKYICCDDSYISEIRRKKAIFEILERELCPESTQFQVYFQPIFSISEGKFKYAEALSRLKNTELGDISPAEFIPVAEEKGLIERLGQITFEKICKFISEHKDTIHAVSVNFSVYQMTNPNIVEIVLNTISKYKIKPENIIMEITESIFIDDFDLIRQRMIELSNAGIVFYLDDFGTGFSNFANVITLPFSTIKIDRSFVQMMEQNAEMVSLIDNLIKTFKESGLKILVEGVENDIQDKLVKDAGTDYIQGFLYAKPISQTELLDFLK